MTRRKAKAIIITERSLYGDGNCYCCDRYKHVGDIIFVLHKKAICKSCVSALFDALKKQEEGDINA